MILLCVILQHPGEKRGLTIHFLQMRHQGLQWGKYITLQEFHDSVS